jgi:hypothetical protein
MHSGRTDLLALRSGQKHALRPRAARLGRAAGTEQCPAPADPHARRRALGRWDSLTALLCSANAAARDHIARHYGIPVLSKTVPDACQGQDQFVSSTNLQQA